MRRSGPVRAPGRGAGAAPTRGAARRPGARGTRAAAAARPVPGGRSRPFVLLLVLLVVLLARLEPGLDVRLAARLELDGGVHLQGDAGQELPDLPAERLALQEAADLLGHDPRHLRAGLVRLRHQETERV